MKYPAVRLAVYETLFALNRDIEQVVAHLERLQGPGMFQQQDFGDIFPAIIQETRAWANLELVAALRPLEQDDWGQIGEVPLKARVWIGGRTMWRTHSCVPRRDSSRRLVLNLYYRQARVETSLDTARTSACATVRQSVLAVQPLEAEDEFERARR